MLPKPQWWITLLSFISASLACVSLIFGYIKLTQSFSGSCDELGCPLLLLLNPMLHWPFVWSLSEANQDTDLAEKWVADKILFSVLAQMTEQTTRLGKLKKHHQTSVRARGSFQEASVTWLSVLSSIFLDSIKIIIKASPSCLDPCNFVFFTHTALPLLST